MTWFYRRPLFWLAGVAVIAVYLAAHELAPAGLWVGCGGAALLLTCLRQPVAGAALAVAGLYGGLTLPAIAPPGGLRHGAPVTLEGEIVHTWGVRGERRLVLVEARRQWTGTGWEPLQARLGASVPDATAEEGDRIRLSGKWQRPPTPGNPGEPSARRRWLRRGVHYLLDVRPYGYTRLERPSRRDPVGWLRTIRRSVRQQMLDANRRSLTPATAFLTNQFLIGDADPPPEAEAEALEQAFRDSGAIHLLVISGTQVTLVLGGFLWLGWRFYRRRVLLWSLGAIAVLLFATVAEESASVLRAACMGGLWVLALLLKREPDGENTLGAAALLLMGFHPLVIENIGAQLSFAALWALVRLQPALLALLCPPTPSAASRERRHLAGLGRSAALLVCPSLAVHLALTPILDFHFQRSAWVGVAANLVLVPLATFFLYAGLAHTLAVLVGGPGVGPVIGWLAGAMRGWAGWFSQPGLGAVDVFPPPAWAVPLLVGAIAVPSACRLSRRATAVWVGLLLSVHIAGQCVPAPAPGAPRVRAVDVGQGDAILLEGADGTRFLVDTGPPAAASRLVRTLRALRIPALDGVLLSHIHQDHTGGLTAVLDALPVRALYCRRLGPAAAWEPLLQAAARRMVPVREPAPGDTLRVGETRLEFLGPVRVVSHTETADVNNGCLVLRWESRGAHALLSGDVETEAEEDLLRWGPALKADLLKVAHHGSRTATGSAWLAAVRPRLAVVSCGSENRFGHPHRETTARLRAADIPLWSTADRGMVTITFPPEGIPHADSFRSVPDTQ